MLFSLSDNRAGSCRLDGIALTLAAWSLSGSVLAAGMEVTGVSNRVVNDIFVVNAAIRYELGDDMRGALENGISLAFDVQIELTEPRKMLWDPVTVRTVQRLRLQYHALSETYVVTNVTTRTRRSFPSLREALLDMGDMRDVAVSETRHLNADTTYRGRIRVTLDVEALPPPLRPVAYLSPHWHLRSAWRRWEVKL
ncbi:MAG: DUF4390 domain-containing protein [Chromatiales bacterium]